MLEDDEKELKKTIAKFEKDELEHHNIGLEHDAENAPGYKIMTKIKKILYIGIKYEVSAINHILLTINQIIFNLHSSSWS